MLVMTNHACKAVDKRAISSRLECPEDYPEVQSSEIRSKFRLSFEIENSPLAARNLDGRELTFVRWAN